MINDSNLGIDIDFTLNDDEIEIQWRRLINEIVNGNVIPVIGPDFLIADTKNLHQQIIDFLAKKRFFCNLVGKDQNMCSLIC